MRVFLKSELKFVYPHVHCYRDEENMKVLYVTTVSNTINAFLIPHIRLLVEQGHTVDVACNIVQDLKDELITLGCSVYNIELQRSPLNRANLNAYQKLKLIISQGKYDLVHTHTPIASACVRLACRKNQQTKVIYTAHGFHFYKGASMLSWLVYYPIEKWLSRYTDILITINKEDYDRAQRSFGATKVIYIPGVGVDINKMVNVVVNKRMKQLQLGIAENSFVLLSVGELNANKNHATVIKGIAKLSNPHIEYLICGEGPLEIYLKELVEQLGLSQQVHFLGYRNDVLEICKITDVFVFPSFREGLSVALMEAMASGLPVVCSKIRGNSDLVDNGEGGFLVHPGSSDAFAESMLNLLENGTERIRMGAHNHIKAKSFDINAVVQEIEKTYKMVERMLERKNSDTSF